MHRLPVITLCLCWPLLATAATVVVPFGLVDPQPNTTVRPGATLAVTVSVGPESGTRRVSYYWYRQEDEPASLPLARPVLVADSAASPPFGGRLTVPRDAIGTLRLLAVAEVAQGRLGIIPEFDERVLTVEPDAVLEAIEFRVEKPWRLTPVGKIALVPIVGEFSDGAARLLEGEGTGTQIRSSDERIVQVLDGGQVRAVGPGKVLLSVESRGRHATLEVVVAGSGEPNGVPRANPGPDQRVKGGSRVVLNGGRSADPDGDPLRFEWTQVRGLKVDLVGPNESSVSFVAPKVSAPRLLRFKLQVTDMSGPDLVKGADSVAAYVNVWVEP